MTIRGMAAGAILVTLGLGLVVATGAQSTTTAIATPDNGPGQQWRRDSEYLTAVRGRDVQGSDAELMTTARSVCQYVQDGRPFPDLVAYVQSRHAPADKVSAAYVVTVAVHTRCPEYDGAMAGALP